MDKAHIIGIGALLVIITYTIVMAVSAVRARRRQPPKFGRLVEPTSTNKMDLEEVIRRGQARRREMPPERLEQSAAAARASIRRQRGASERLVPRYDDPVPLAVIMAAALPDSTPTPTHHTPSDSWNSSLDNGGSSSSSDSSGSAGGSDSSGSASGSEGGSW